MYDLIHKRFIEDVGVNCYCNKKDFVIIMTKMYHIPKKAVFPVMKELEEEQMITIDSKDVKILKPKRDIEDNMNKIYQKMGIF